MPETMNERMNRRKYLRYIGAGIVAAVGAGIGCYYFKYKTQPIILPTSPTSTSVITTPPITQTLTQTKTITHTPTLTPLASYAKSKGLSDLVIERLESKLGDKLTDNNKALIDYLYELSKAEVVSPEVLKFAPSNYKNSLVESLQLKAIDDVTKDSKVTDETVVGLGYLSNFPGYTQRWYIEQHGLDASAIDLLNKAKSLGNQDFAKYAVESLVCIQDHNPLSKAEIAFLENPGNKFRGVRDSYLADMESKGNLYADLAKEWSKMLNRSGLNREMESLDATEDIVFLALQGKPYEKFEDRFDSSKITKEKEVYEAFELMLKGGTPNQSDFKYHIPNWNTELQVLYWLAKQNEFKLNDTLAQAIAMVNGLWVTIGDDQVRKAVYKDTNDLLNFFRETNEIQKARGYYQLENYPLEAKVCLAWTGGLNMHWIGPLTQPKIPMRLVYYQDRRLPLIVYEKDTVSINTLRKMREIANENGWWHGDIGKSIKVVEEFFYFYPHHPGYWEFASCPELILDDDGLDAWLDVDWQFNRFLNGKPPRGDCGTETVFVDAWAKSMGIATAVHWMYKLGEKVDSSSWYSHHYAIYFNLHRSNWTAYEKQVSLLVPENITTSRVRYFIFRPPVNQSGYLRYQIRWKDNIPDYYYPNLAYTIDEVPITTAQEMMERGIDTVTMKRLLFYS